MGWRFRVLVWQVGGYWYSVIEYALYNYVMRCGPWHMTKVAMENWEK